VPRAAWILISVAVALIVPLAVAVVFLIGKSSDTSGDTGGSTAGPQPLQLPLARDPRALMFARDLEPILIGLAARRGGPVEVAVLDGESEVARDELSFKLDRREVDAAPCGYGCSRLDAPVLAGKQRSLVVAVRGRGSARFALPARLPPSGAAVFRRVRRAMRSLRSYRYGEVLSSGVGSPVRTRFEARAPDRLRFKVTNGAQTVIVGQRRWDRVDGRWAQSSFPGLSTRSFMWDGASQARLVGPRVLSVFSYRSVPAWFRLTIGPDARVVEATMIAPSHFMVQSFSRFNSPLRIEPPR
jgi:hypothetical protein